LIRTRATILRRLLADPVAPTDTLAPLNADKAVDGFNQPPQEVTDFARSQQLTQLEEPLPQAPAATWDQLSQSPRFQGLAPADKLTVVKKYAGNLLDWQQSQTGADATGIADRINKWVEDRHNELFPAPQPKDAGFVDTFRKQFGEHLYTALSGAAQKAASDAEHPGWIGGIVDSVLHKLGASDETKQENVEQLKLAADEFRKSATGYGQQIGVQEGAKESKLAQFAEPIFEMVSLSRLGLHTLPLYQRP
jgi:hypothetical protein